MEASLERRAALDAARDVRRLEMLATNAQARAGLRILFSEARRHGLGVSFAGVSLQAQSSQSGAGSHAAVPPSPARPRDAQHRAPSPAAAPPAGAPATSRKSRQALRHVRRLLQQWEEVPGMYHEVIPCFHRGPGRVGRRPAGARAVARPRRAWRPQGPAARQTPWSVSL